MISVGARRSVWTALTALALLACPLNAAHAQQDDLLTGYALTSWHDDAGRALGAVHGIAQDAEGYLWLSADAGLLRFDGSRFTRWSRFGGGSQSPRVPDVPAHGLLVARDTSLWVGFSQREGVGRITNGQFTRYRDGLNGIEVVTDLAQDASGAMWAIGDRALFTLDAGSWRKVALPWKAIEGQVYHVYVARDGQMWVATRWGVFRRKGDSETFQLVSEALVWGIGEDTDGRLWTTDLATGLREIGQPLPSLTVPGGGYRLISDRDGHLWLSTFGAGLWRVTRGDGTVSVRRAVTRTGLSSDTVQAIFEDRDGSIWAGTTSGLHRFTRRRLTPIDEFGTVLATAPAPDGGLWVGTTGGLLQSSLAADAGGGRTIGPGTPDIRTFYADGRGVLWMGTGDGLWRLEGGQLAKLPMASRPQMLARWLAPHRQGGFWIGDSDWLYRWKTGRLEPITRTASMGPTARIRFAGADASDRVWLGLSDGHTGFIDERDQFQPVGPREGLPDGTHTAINAVFEDREGAVWLGGNGLSRYADGRVVTVTSANGLPDGRVWAIVDDAPGNLWLITDRGIVRLGRDELRRAVTGRANRIHYTLYDARDGMAGSAVGVINAARAADGSLWFAQGGGLTHVDPQHLASAPGPAPPRPQLAAVVADETRTLRAPLASFPAGTRRLEIQYTTPTLSDSTRARFRYRLDGVDASWVDAGTERTAIYTNLAAGRYRFRVGSAVEGAEGNSPDAVWTFQIRPFFYETPWFYGLTALAFLFTLWGAWRTRLRLLEQRFSLALAERARLSHEIHDTLLQSMLGVALQVEAVSASLEPAAPARQNLVGIRRRLEQSMRDARQSILDLRSPFLEGRDLAAALRAFARTAVGTSGTRCTVTATGRTTGYPPKIEHQLLRVGQEAITNASRHARASHIRVELRGDALAIVLSVSDNGHGFDDTRAREDGHYGLRTMAERVEELGGQFRVTSTMGRGTTVTAVVPMTASAHETRLTG